MVSKCCVVCVGNINNDGFQRPMKKQYGHWTLDIAKPEKTLCMEFLSVKKKEQFQENKTYKENENKRLIQLGHQSVYKPIIVICKYFFGFCNRNEKNHISYKWKFSTKQPKTTKNNVTLLSSSSSSKKILTINIRRRRIDASLKHCIRVSS